MLTEYDLEWINLIANDPKYDGFLPDRTGYSYAARDCHEKLVRLGILQRQLNGWELVMGPEEAEAVCEVVFA